MSYQNLNLEPLQRLLTQEIKPEALADKLDDLVYDYTRVLIYAQFGKPRNEPSYMNSYVDDYFVLVENITGCT